ncbi:MAG: hypothetical protein BWX99_02640 [Deltaproteobacteria bacterium ADurb.Bin151]|jgi:hypothetical protein|nr:MAG: hypothetical protein BWX99_02640 [Deltaproteobacteria bacterium ADurb.Bin151]
MQMPPCIGQNTRGATVYPFNSRALYTYLLLTYGSKASPIMDFTKNKYIRAYQERANHSQFMPGSSTGLCETLFVRTNYLATLMSKIIKVIQE